MFSTSLFPNREPGFFEENSEQINQLLSIISDSVDKEINISEKERDLIDMLEIPEGLYSEFKFSASFGQPISKSEARRIIERHTNRENNNGRYAQFAPIYDFDIEQVRNLVRSLLTNQPPFTTNNLFNGKAFLVAKFGIYDTDKVVIFLTGYKAEVNPAGLQKPYKYEGSILNSNGLNSQLPGSINYGQMNSMVNTYIHSLKSHSFNKNEYLVDRDKEKGGIKELISPVYNSALLDFYRWITSNIFTNNRVYFYPSFSDFDYNHTSGIFSNDPSILVSPIHMLVDRYYNHGTSCCP
ncbi:hypothetical protein [Jiulongibacter sediminis]|jgi:hypothetical protein|uniref:hypothetical protein n=1 Tax=Jiulongibacter sediminis TaxID=1605367 RepID=UPI0026F1CCB0|nr:hypothetical protein [Jiulongibacter sediminis]